jgi:apolipoprotein N-acyltransferase
MSPIDVRIQFNRIISGDLMADPPAATAKMEASDTNHKPSNSGKVDSGHPWFWLFLAAALLLVADGRNTVAIAAWLAPVCLMRFMRTQTWRYALAGAFAVRLGTLMVAYRGMIPIPGVFYYLFLIVASAIALLPYVADRWLVKRLTPVIGTLVFPTATVAVQFLMGFGPHGTWGSAAYTQAGDLPLLQLLAITGLGGVTFLVMWLAPVANLLLEEGLSCRPAQRVLGIFAAVFLSVFFLGGLRLALFPVVSPVVRVASLSPPADGPVIGTNLLNRVISGKASAADLDQFNSAAGFGQDALLAGTQREARAGSKIVFWSEGAATVLHRNEPELIARGRALALQYKIYLGMSVASWTPGAQRPLENKIILIEPTGQIAWQYTKAHPTPGPEMSMAVPHDGRLRQIASPYGRLSAAICYDMDFPRLIAQAGAFGADIVLSPAHDWRAIDPRHTEMASFRGIEEGFNLVRQSDGGLSAAYDYQGRRLAVADDAFRNAALVARIPITGTRTLYSLAGDWFSWLCVLCTFSFFFLARRNPSAHFTGSPDPGAKRLTEAAAP